MPATGDLASIPHPDWESPWQPFGSQAYSIPYATQAREFFTFLKLMFPWVYLTHKSPRVQLSFENDYKNAYNPEWFGFLKTPYLVCSFRRKEEVGKLNYSV